MQILNLYKFIRDDGGVTVSPIKPNGDYTEMFRLIADEGKELLKDGSHTVCTDVESIDGQEEVEATTMSDDDKTYSGLLEED